MVYQIKYKGRSSFSRCGFSLTEVIVVLAIFAIFAVISDSIYSNVVSSNSLEIAANSVVTAMRKAQSNSSHVNNDSSWGVYIATTSVTIFRGTSYAARTIGSEQTLNFPAKTSASGLNEIVFAKLTSLPSISGTTTIINTTSSTKNIFINEKGTIIY